MKKILLILAIFSFALHSCNSDGKKEFSSQDSVLINNDSVVSDADKQLPNKESENMHQDSIKKITAEKSEDSSFEKSLPEPKKIFWNSNCGKYLKKLGFKGSSHPNDWSEFGCKSGTYTLEMGNKKCKVFFDDRAESAIVKITITGDDKALEAYYKRAKKLAYKGSDGEIIVEKKGKTVIVSGGSAGF